MGAVVVGEHRRVLVGLILHEGVKRIPVRVPNHAGIDPVSLPIFRANCESLANWPTRIRLSPVRVIVILVTANKGLIHPYRTIERTRTGPRCLVLNRSYKEMVRHYGAAIVPARRFRPKDKAKVEKGVQLVETGLLEALRHQRFPSLAEVNEALRAGRVRRLLWPACPLEWPPLPRSWRWREGGDRSRPSLGGGECPNNCVSG